MRLDFIKNLTYGDRIARFIIGSIFIELVGFKVLHGWLALVAVILAIGLFLEGIFAY
jgi:hypothetical protein